MQLKRKLSRFIFKCSYTCFVGSVSTELRDLEAKRQKLQSEIASYSHKIDLLKSELNRHQAELNRLKLSVIQVRFQIIRLISKII